MQDVMYLVHIETMQGLTALGTHSPACHKSENSWFVMEFETKLNIENCND